MSKIPGMRTGEWGAERLRDLKELDLYPKSTFDSTGSELDLFEERLVLEYSLKDYQVKLMNYAIDQENSFSKAAQLDGWVSRTSAHRHRKKLFNELKKKGFGGRRGKV